MATNQNPVLALGNFKIPQPFLTLKILELMLHKKAAELLQQNEDNHFPDVKATSNAKVFALISGSGKAVLVNTETLKALDFDDKDVLLNSEWHTYLGKDGNTWGSLKTNMVKITVLD